MDYFCPWISTDPFQYEPEKEGATSVRTESFVRNEGRNGTQKCILKFYIKIK